MHRLEQIENTSDNDDKMSRNQFDLGNVIKLHLITNKVQLY